MRTIKPARKKKPLVREKSISQLGAPQLLDERAIVIDNLARDLSVLFKELRINNRISISRATTRGARREVDFRNAPAHAHAIGELLTIWHQDPKYLDNLGNPIPLRMNGRTKSFRILARKSAPKLSPTYLLDELTKLGVLTIDARGVIQAKSRSLPIYNDAELASLHTLRTLRGFIATLNHNLRSGPESADQLFHRIACNRNLDKTNIPRLRIWLQRHGQNLLESADNWMNSHARLNRAKRPSKGSPSQVSIGIYLAVE